MSESFLDKIFNLASNQLTYDEIAAVLETTVSEVYKHKDTVKQGRLFGQAQIKMKMYQIAVGNSEDSRVCADYVLEKIIPTVRQKDTKVEMDSKKDDFSVFEQQETIDAEVVKVKKSKRGDIQNK